MVGIRERTLLNPGSLSVTTVTGVRFPIYLLKALFRPYSSIYGFRTPMVKTEGVLGCVILVCTIFQSG